MANHRLSQSFFSRLNQSPYDHKKHFNSFSQYFLNKFDQILQIYTNVTTYVSKTGIYLNYLHFSQLSVAVTTYDGLKASFIFVALKRFLFKMQSNEYHQTSFDKTLIKFFGCKTRLGLTSSSLHLPPQIPKKAKFTAELQILSLMWKNICK